MKYFVVDAFADKIFEGNPAGVCIMNDWISDELMQKIAMENNLSETAFAVKDADYYQLRWFAPGGEVNLCGHATLATAFVILNYYEKQLDSVKFNTISGELTVNKQDDLYELDFPSVPSEEISITDQMINALGTVPKEAWLNRDLVFILESEEEVKNVNPDFALLERLPDGLGVCVTAEGSKFDFVSRAFFPKLKVNEDPVTGSLHCSLIPLWTIRLGKEEMVARQISTRGGTLYCKHEDTRVKIAGRAALYSIAELYIAENK
ncbi:PhzF family phenazine biosynthesis protein [Evansella cellulosilytica]|uniref:Phenazine biosynthesis protein PhzF family n=1 Tax=Evansella cellulosilytica (strain ATCC 21833 / DSM 2522 / FERM P-1141 / JCM 9156 / N-4) TaxID=649639 RepID=E6TSK4_EVAC2|nr:PhzF family phenazine biosynthesis isomerase [Evansella cellulosilytica]ADU29512.1 phenazine biosynthesis protein PhzF family [Evansella cellulosilytica DSM 2522]